MGPRLKNCHVVRDIDQGGAPTSPPWGGSVQSWHTLWDLLPASATPALTTHDTRTHHAAEGDMVSSHQQGSQQPPSTPTKRATMDAWPPANRPLDVADVIDPRFADHC
jgi:hypothetical protein